MNVVARKRAIPSLDDLPESIRSLKGFELFTEGESHDAPTEFPSGVWQLRLTFPADLADIEDHVDPLLMLHGLAAGSSDLEAKLIETVRFCRSRGKTWTQIGEVMGMTKQAAWERFSGED